MPRFLYLYNFSISSDFNYLVFSTISWRAQRKQWESLLRRLRTSLTKITKRSFLQNFDMKSLVRLARSFFFFAHHSPQFLMNTSSFSTFSNIAHNRLQTIVACAHSTTHCSNRSIMLSTYSSTSWFRLLSQSYCTAVQYHIQYSSSTGTSVLQYSARSTYYR